jgi:hypothetical protein
LNWPERWQSKEKYGIGTSVSIDPAAALIQWPLRPDRLRLSHRWRQRPDYLISQSEASWPIAEFSVNRFVRFPNLIPFRALNPLFTEARSLLRRIHEEVKDV